MMDTTSLLTPDERRICRRLGIDHPSLVEIETKRRVDPGDVSSIRKHLLKKMGAAHQKSSLFFDQFLDTRDMAVFRVGASLRLRYKKNGSQVYLQYKGPGYRRDGVLFRSEFSSAGLRGVLLEESRHDVIHFNKRSIAQIMKSGLPPPMTRAMRAHLGAATIERIRAAPIIALYQKDKFLVKAGRVFLEPSLDRVFAFHIGRSGPHPLSTFCEYENEIKSENASLQDKIKTLPALLSFDRAVCKSFSLKPERLDKYHRCASFFARSERS